MMRFAEPNTLFFLFFVIPAVWLLFWLIGRRKKILCMVADGGLWRELTGNVSWRTRRWKAVLLALVLIFSIVALARPQWGFELREVRQQGIDILLAIDVSRSMLTQDVSPTRLDRAKLAVRDLISRLRGDRVGLIAFAGEAFVVCPLTSDYNGVLMSLNMISMDSVARGGTNAASAIREAVRLYQEKELVRKIFVILTDGENLEDDVLTAAREAGQKGVKIYTVGIGTAEGDLIHVPDGRGGYEFLKDTQGNFIKSRLNESLLQSMAVSTGGLYVRSGGAQFGLDVIYEREFARLEKTESDIRVERRYFERFQWPLAVAVLFLIIETALPVRKKDTRPFVSVFWVLGVIFCLQTPVSASTVAGDVRRGNKLYAQEDYSAAAEKYQQALQKDQESDIINFNAGAAWYQSGNVEKALEHFQKALLSSDERLRQQAYYNLGNSFYRLAEGASEPQAAVPLLERSLDQYEQALGLREDDEDARHNYAFVQYVLEKIKEQIAQQQNQCDRSDKDSGTEEDSQNRSGQPSGQGNEEQNASADGQDETQDAAMQDDPSFQDQPQDQPAGSDGTEQDLSRREAQMRLMEYQRNEQPPGMLNLRGRVDPRPVEKDW
jgi:Ca-activated chloride channel homolog